MSLITNCTSQHCIVTGAVVVALAVAYLGTRATRSHAAGGGSRRSLRCAASRRCAGRCLETARYITQRPTETHTAIDNSQSVSKSALVLIRSSINGASVALVDSKARHRTSAYHTHSIKSTNTERDTEPYIQTQAHVLSVLPPPCTCHVARQSAPGTMSKQDVRNTGSGVRAAESRSTSTRSWPSVGSWPSFRSLVGPRGSSSATTSQQCHTIDSAREWDRQVCSRRQCRQQQQQQLQCTRRATDLKYCASPMTTTPGASGCAREKMLTEYCVSVGGATTRLRVVGGSF